MESNFSQRVKDVITYSREEALRLGHDYIGIEHLLLGMLREGQGVGIQILNALGTDLNGLRRMMVFAPKTITLTLLELLRVLEHVKKPALT